MDCWTWSPDGNDQALKASHQAIEAKSMHVKLSPEQSHGFNHLQSLFKNVS